MPVDFTGYWKMLANENFEEYLRALGKRRPPHSARAAQRLPEPAVQPLSEHSGAERASGAGGPRAENWVVRVHCGQCLIVGSIRHG